MLETLSGAHLHRILQALRKFAPYFTRFTQMCTVFYELYTNLHRILQAWRKFAPYFTSFTQIDTVFHEIYANLVRHRRNHYYGLRSPWRIRQAAKVS